MIANDKMRAALADPLARKVLRTVVARKSVRLPDLVDADMTRDVVTAVIAALTQAHLIKGTSAPIADLSTYFVTADGLRASREAGE